MHAEVKFINSKLTQKAITSNSINKTTIAAAELCAPVKLNVFSSFAIKLVQ